MHNARDPRVKPGMTALVKGRDKMDKQYYVYIVSNKPRGSLYIGFTSGLPKRAWEHKNKVVKGFTERYNLDRLVHFEVFADPENAIKREKNLKKWNRDWKIELIEKTNPEWTDLYEEICK